MHGGGMDAMSMPLLPGWLRVACVVALSAVVMVHVAHAWARLMYALPTMSHAEWNRVGLALFSLATIAMAAVTIVLRFREGALNPLWLFSGLDMLAIAYMLAPSPARPAWLTVVVVAYLSGQVAAWGFGWWDRLPVWRPRVTGAPRAAAMTWSWAAPPLAPTCSCSRPRSDSASTPRW